MGAQLPGKMHGRPETVQPLTQLFPGKVAPVFVFCRQQLFPAQPLHIQGGSPSAVPLQLCGKRPLRHCGFRKSKGSVRCICRRHVKRRTLHSRQKKPSQHFGGGILSPAAVQKDAPHPTSPHFRKESACKGSRVSGYGKLPDIRAKDLSPAKRLTAAEKSSRFLRPPAQNRKRKTCFCPIGRVFRSGGKI